MLPDWPAGTVTILATGGRMPHAIPVSAAVRAGPRTILVGLGARRESLARLRSEPAVAVAILAEGNLALTAYGTARALREQLPGDVVAVRIEVDHVQDHGRATFAIDAGVSWRWTDRGAEQRDAEVRAGLERIAASGASMDTASGGCGG